jgi:putative DNA primase/helicase
VKDDNVEVDGYMAEVRRKNGWPARRGKKVVAGDDVRPFSDDALALRFAKLRANDLRYVAEWSKWLRYDGVRWQFDNTLAVFDSVRVICRAAAAECNKARPAKALASAKTVAAVERLARSDRRLAATVDQWDADLWLLNTPEGVIDLRTGSMRAHRAEDYLIHMTAVAPGGDCPQWHVFLERVTANDKSLQQYLQRVCGYALTGLTHEHALFFFYGKGANGKTTFVRAVAGVLEDYHRTAPIETFAASHTDRHPTELADLRGARLVTANETEEGRRWAESRINMLTGGDRVRARFMRQDLFEFTPQLKLVISGNHKPSLRSVNEAARRRFNLIPFTVTIPAEERDKDLSDKLKAEWPGILQWMIDGCVDWQERGLAPPEVITAATTAYLDAQDTVAAWLDECCELDANTWERSQTLFASWKAWAERSGQFVGDIKTFRDRLDGRDGIEFRKQPGTKRAGFQGVRLRPPEEPPIDPYYDR